MKTCCLCDRPANVKRTNRDDWGRAHDIFLCDHHAAQFDKEDAHATKPVPTTGVR